MGRTKMVTKRIVSVKHSLLKRECDSEGGVKVLVLYEGISSYVYLTLSKTDLEKLQGKWSVEQAPLADDENNGRFNKISCIDRSTLIKSVCETADGLLFKNQTHCVVRTCYFCNKQATGVTGTLVPSTSSSTEQAIMSRRGCVLYCGRGLCRFIAENKSLDILIDEKDDKPACCVQCGQRMLARNDIVTCMSCEQGLYCSHKCRTNHSRNHSWLCSKEAATAFLRCDSTNTPSTDSDDESINNGTLSSDKEKALSSWRGGKKIEELQVFSNLASWQTCKCGGIHGTVSYILICFVKVGAVELKWRCQ